MNFFNLFFPISQKYTTDFKFSKTILQLLHPMAVGTNHHGPWQLIAGVTVSNAAIAVAHGGRVSVFSKKS
jgi:hypothetical protein